MIFVSAGFDAHEQDPLAQLALNKADYIWVTQWILEMAKTYSNQRVVSLLEGGYHLASLAESVEAHLQTLVAQPAS
jgi:acetoin utilization deacetylase AcuC-like enzyme